MPVDAVGFGEFGLRRQLRSPRELPVSNLHSDPVGNLPSGGNSRAASDRQPRLCRRVVAVHADSTARHGIVTGHGHAVVYANR